jgi:hypothetical protein
VTKANSSDENEAVFGPAALKLGEMHWYILRASHLMYEKTTIEIKVGIGGFVQHKDTDFGKEVGRDEINWWVFKKEPDIEELKKQTTRALEAAQKLKEASKPLTRKRAETYAELLETLRRFAEGHAAEIDALHQYVFWLNSRDPVAPVILFTYRVWGSTRMGDRTVKFDGSELAPKIDTIKGLTEILLGLTNNFGTSVMFRAEYEIGSDMWETYEGAEFEVPMDKVAHLASHMAFEEFAEYFELVRDSLRNILLDIGKFIEQRDLVNDDAFWRSFIEKATQSQKAEPLLFDFKETLTMWHTKTTPETERAKVVFCEDVASFANARGGVLIIGVTDNREIVGIGSGRELENRLKFASDVLSKHVEYGREIIRLRQVVLPGKDGKDKICLVIVVADACEPVGVHDGQGHYTYPVRRETGLTRVSRDEVLNPKLYQKSDNYDFLRELYQFVHQN